MRAKEEAGGLTIAEEEDKRDITIKVTRFKAKQTFGDATIKSAPPASSQRRACTTIYREIESSPGYTPVRCTRLLSERLTRTLYVLPQRPVIPIYLRFRSKFTMYRNYPRRRFVRLPFDLYEQDLARGKRYKISVDIYRIF